MATFGGLAGFSRYMRQSMLEVVRQDYIQTARAKGLSERVVIGKHALRNALLPVVTILGLSLPGLIGGSVIIESIFAIPGMGQLMVQAVFARDYPVMMGNLVIVATLTLFANLVADIAYGLVDPRIRFGGRRAATLTWPRDGARGDAPFWRTFSRNQLAVCGGVGGGWCWSILAVLAPLLAPWDPNRPDTKKILDAAVDAATGSAPISSAATCSRACSTARGSRWRWASSRSGIAAADRDPARRRRRLPRRRWSTTIIMRLVDLMLVFPRFFLLLAVLAFLKPSIWTIMAVIGLTGWMGVARLVRAEFLTLREREFVIWSESVGRERRSASSCATSCPTPWRPSWSR